MLNALIYYHANQLKIVIGTSLKTPGCTLLHFKYCQLCIKEKTKTPSLFLHPVTALITHQLIHSLIHTCEILTLTLDCPRVKLLLLVFLNHSIYLPIKPSTPSTTCLSSLVCYPLFSLYILFLLLFLLFPLGRSTSSFHFFFLLSRMFLLFFHHPPLSPLQTFVSFHSCYCWGVFYGHPLKRDFFFFNPSPLSVLIGFCLLPTSNSVFGF